MPTKRRRREGDDDDRPRRRRRDDEDDEDERPARRPRRRKSSGTRVALIVGGGVACLVLVVVLIGAGGRKSEDDKIRPGQIGNAIENPDYATPQGISKHLGVGHPISQDEWSRLKLTSGSGDDKEERTLASWIGYSPGKPVPTVYKWSAKDEDMYVAFWPSSRAIDMIPKRTAIMHHHTPGQKPMVLKHAAY